MFQKSGRLCVKNVLKEKPERVFSDDWEIELMFVRVNRKTGERIIE
jgi:hypothetical protein